MDWLTSSEALKLLGTQPQTLYANVSRGRIKARPDPADNRRSLYRGDDVRRLVQRAAGRRKQEAIAVAAIHWGEPVLNTAISTVSGGRLRYRGQDVCHLAESAALEDIAVLLWQTPLVLDVAGTAPVGQGVTEALVALAQQAGLAHCAARFPIQAGTVLGTLANALAGNHHADVQLHERLALHWHRPEAADGIRRALVLLADHELNASTFAARVTVSTGASLWAGALSGLAALTGPLHGQGSREIAALAEDLCYSSDHALDAMRDWLGDGRVVPGIGHPLYLDGDPRSAALLQALDLPEHFLAYRNAAEALTGDAPNIDFALAALVARFNLPAGAGFTLFALARSVGWLAHMIEQIETGQLIRPRARYVGS